MMTALIQPTAVTTALLNLDSTVRHFSCESYYHRIFAQRNAFLYQLEKQLQLMSVLLTSFHSNISAIVI